MARFDAVLFDLDGTLLDTLADIADAVNAVLTRAGLPTHETEAYKRFVGEGVVRLVEQALPADRRDATTLATTGLAVRAEYGRCWRRKTRPYPEIAKMLDALVERGIRLAVLSNKPHDFTEEAVAHFLKRWLFAAVVGAGDYPIKPDPAGALAIAERMALPPKRFLYLGDSGVDMQTAAAAGMYPVGALWGFRGADELTAAGAAELIERPDGLLALIG